jgi:uncharacterized peroxidase-related enzyme
MEMLFSLFPRYIWPGWPLCSSGPKAAQKLNFLKLSMPHIELRTDLAGITSLLDYRRQTAGPLCELTQLLLRGPSTLTEAEREHIATFVSKGNDCTFCATAHASAACILDGSRGEPDAMHSPKMLSLIHIAGKVRSDGRLVTAEDADHARKLGATDLEIHDTVLIAALFCLYNRYVDGLATVTPADPAYYDALGQRITTRGYLMPDEAYQPLNI